MTTKNKTGDKLVASIRKSKSGNVASKTTPPSEPAHKPETEVAESGKKRSRQDGYSHRNRVWPD